MGLRCPSAESWTWALGSVRTGLAESCGGLWLSPLPAIAATGPRDPCTQGIGSMQLSHDTENQSALGALPRHQQVLNPALVAVVQKEVEGSLEDPNKS